MLEYNVPVNHVILDVEKMRNTDITTMDVKNVHVDQKQQYCVPIVDVLSVMNMISPPSLQMVVLCADVDLSQVLQDQFPRQYHRQVQNHNQHQ